MRILIVSSHAAPVTGGSAVVYDQLARASDSIAVLAASEDYASGEAIEGFAAFDAAAPYPVERVPLLRPSAAKSWRSPFDKLQTIGRMAMTWRAVTAAARRHRADVVCIGDLVSLGWLTRVLRWPTVLYVHGEEAAYADLSMFHRMRRDSLHRASRIVAVSSFTAALLQQRYGVPAERITLVPNGVDTVRFQPDPAGAERLRAQHGINGRPLVVALSRLVERKGFDVLVAAMARVVAVQPDAICLIGGSGPMRKALQQQIVEAGLGAHVRLIGAVPDADIAGLYSAADLFCVPNRTLADGDTEGFGLVFLEANACGTPVVGGRAGGAVDAIDDGETGYLVDSTRPEVVAEAIVRILSDRALRDRLAAGGLDRARRSTWKHSLERFMEACRAALDRG